MAINTYKNHCYIIMKRHFLLILFTCSSLAICAQTKKGKVKDSKPAQNSNAEFEIRRYNQAIKYGDISVAINSIYTLITKYPDQASYKDSLARIYFQVGSFNQCLRVCEDFSISRPNDTTILRMMAMSHQSLGFIAEAIAEFEQVVKQTGNVYDIYQKATLEYRIKRLQESKISIETVIAKATVKDMITLYIDKENKQEVPLQAAAFNLYGMIAKEFNDTASARFLFNKAIELFPEFYFANANIKFMNESGKTSQEPDPATEPGKEDLDERRKK